MGQHQDGVCTVDVLTVDVLTVDVLTVDVLTVVLTVELAVDSG